jgi:hypothetical protein
VTSRNKVTVYLNGKLYVSLSTTASRASINCWAYGGIPNGQFSISWSGALADVKSWLRPLTVREVQLEMQQQVPLSFDRLHGAWVLSQNTAPCGKVAGVANVTPAGTVTRVAGSPVPFMAFRRRVVRAPSGGGTVYTATVAGVVTPVGVVVKGVNKTLSGVITPVGVVSKGVSKVLSGSVTVSGVVVKRVSKVFAGVVSPVGVVSAALRKAISLAGSVSPVGVVVKRVDKVFSGAVVPVGSIVKVVSKSFVGSVSLTGVLVKQVNKILVGAVNGVGALTSNVISGGGQLYTATLVEWGFNKAGE